LKSIFFLKNVLLVFDLIFYSKSKNTKWSNLATSIASQGVFIVEFIRKRQSPSCCIYYYHYL